MLFKLQSTILLLSKYFLQHISIVEFKSLGNLSVLFLVLILLLYFIILVVELLNGVGGTLNSLQNIGDMLVPFHGGVGHAEVDLSLLLHVCVFSLFSNFHCTIEVFGGRVEIALLS